MKILSFEKGFTLIEVMIVLVIMGGIIALGMPYLSSRNSKTKGYLRELTVLSRELHTKAKLQGVVFRLVISMPGENAQGKRLGQVYWVEKANGGTVMKANEEEEAMERAKETDPTKQADPNGFSIDKQLVKTPRELPQGMMIDKVELTRLQAPITTGKAYIHYLPQGLVDEAAIHIKGEKNQEWTVAIHPLTGKAELIAKPVSLQEIKSQ